MDINKLFQSKVFKGAVLGIAAVLIFLVGFRVGLTVGARKADFSYHWGENYHRNFGGPRGGFMMMKDFGDRDFIEANGAFGQIIKIDGPTLVIKGRNDVEKIILLKEGAVIKRFMETIKPMDLKLDDHIVVIGEPNDAGQIEAKLIRIIPPPPRGRR
jgi:hypothetical protein